MIHPRQQFTFGLEACEHVLAVHAGLDHLQRHLAPYRLELLRQVNRAHATDTELSLNLVRPNPLPDQTQV